MDTLTHMFKEYGDEHAKYRPFRRTEVVEKKQPFYTNPYQVSDGVM